ncbi:proline-rich protein 4 [Pistacia vera]|uniref:proline-rich protein 4 n=1 Tax=Pistacia vera TaxID=55513 RepID=UPI0012633D7D|nr:proline-rich protein 4 [Pistacia vera]
MRILSASREALLCFLVSLLFSASFCHGSSDDKTTTTLLFGVVGTGECADCSDTNFKTSQAVSGLRVTIDCKPENGVFKTRGSGELDAEGKFTVSLPQEIVEDGKLKEECYAQLHSASAAPCPAHDGLESSKIVLKTKTNGKHTFGLAGKLKFSPVTCTSAFLWPHYKYPPLPKYSHPKFNLPPLKSFGHQPFPFPPKVFPPKPPLPSLPPKPPLFKKPFPPKVLPPPVPYKPLPPPVPVVKPLPPPVPIYKPKPKPPIFVKPLPPPIPKVLFTVSLPQEIVEDGKLKEECYAQLHSASAAPCPAHDGLESFKIVFKKKTNGKHTFGLAGKLKFSPVTCTSAFLWPHYKYPPLPNRAVSRTFVTLDRSYFGTI